LNLTLLLSVIRSTEMSVVVAVLWWQKFILETLPMQDRRVLQLT
jgi:hypothetical protein